MVLNKWNNKWAGDLENEIFIAPSKEIDYVYLIIENEKREITTVFKKTEIFY